MARMTTTREALVGVRDKRIVLISHDLSQTGSPLLLIETAIALRKAGAIVRVVTLASDAQKDNLAARSEFEVLPVADSFAQCAQADLVVANTAEAGSWVDAYLRKCPAGARSLIWWIHEIDAWSYAGRMQSLGEVAFVLFDSYASLRNWMSSGVATLPAVRVIHPCVDAAFVERAARSRFVFPREGILGTLPFKMATYGRAAVRRKLGIEPDDFVVTLIGTYLPQKGHDLFADTIGRLADETPSLAVKMIVVGFGSPSKRKQFMARLNRAARKALGYRRAVRVVRDLTPYYAATDAFVMNSQGLGENFGRVTIEAMTFKLPVLGTNAGGTPEIVEDGVTGLLHPVGTAGQSKLTDNILTLMNHRETATAMGEAGYRRVREEFNGSRFYAEFGATLEVIFGRRCG